MRLSIPRTIGILALIFVLVTLPSGAAHVSAEVNPSGWGASVSCSATSNLLPTDNTCIRSWNVPSGASHVHNTFFFPLGFVGDLSINIKEPIPIVGDYVTYYYRQCTTLVPYNGVTGATCGGGQVRDWHSGMTHRWTGAGDAKVCEPLFCTWMVATTWY